MSHIGNTTQASPLRVTNTIGARTNPIELEVDDDYGQPPKEFTEVFSWGSDRFGQLGLGQQMSSGKATHNLPRLCSYNIPIAQISCGAKHAAFLTSKSSS